MGVEELRKSLNLKPRNSKGVTTTNELLAFDNQNNFQGLLKSKISKYISANSLDYLFQKVDDKLQYATVKILVFADGFVVYSEDGLERHKTMYLKNPSDTSEYNGKISTQSLGIYKVLLQSCLEAERVLAPKGLVPKEYSIGLQIKKGLWNDISYSIHYREGLTGRER